MNKDKRNNIKLLGTLNNADESGIIANANQIYDANEDKSTQDVSKEHKERIKTLETKENSMQTTLENITKTGEASAASNVTYNHSNSKLDATNVQQAIDEVSRKSQTTVINGNVINNPDNEDLEQITDSDGNDVLRFKDNEYAPKVFSGLGRKYLRKNIVNTYKIFLNDITDNVSKTDGYYWNFSDGVGAIASKVSRFSLGYLQIDAKAGEEYIISGSYTSRYGKYFWACLDSSNKILECGNTTEGDSQEVITSDIVISKDCTLIVNLIIYLNPEYSVKKIVKSDTKSNINILNSPLFKKENTIYYIKYDYDINNGIVELPKNSVLFFIGGSIKNGTIIGNKSIIYTIGNYNILNDCSVKGTWNTSNWYAEWFGAKGDGITDDTDAVQRLLNLSIRIKNIRINCILDNNYFITKGLLMQQNSSINGHNSGIITAKFSEPLDWVLQNSIPTIDSHKQPGYNKSIEWGDFDSGAFNNWSAEDVTEITGITIKGQLNDNNKPIFGGIRLMGCYVNTSFINIDGVGVGMFRSSIIGTSDNNLIIHGYYYGYVGSSLNGISIRDLYVTTGFYGDAIYDSSYSYTWKISGLYPNACSEYIDKDNNLVPPGVAIMFNAWCTELLLENIITDNTFCGFAIINGQVNATVINYHLEAVTQCYFYICSSNVTLVNPNFSSSPKYQFCLFFANVDLVNKNENNIGEGNVTGSDHNLVSLQGSQFNIMGYPSQICLNDDSVNLLSTYRDIYLLPDSTTHISSDKFNLFPKDAVEKCSKDKELVIYVPANNTVTFDNHYLVLVGNLSIFGKNKTTSVISANYMNKITNTADTSFKVSDLTYAASAPRGDCRDTVIINNCIVKNPLSSSEFLFTKNGTTRILKMFNSTIYYVPKNNCSFVYNVWENNGNAIIETNNNVFSPNIRLAHFNNPSADNVPNVEIRSFKNSGHESYKNKIVWHLGNNYLYYNIDKKRYEHWNGHYWGDINGNAFYTKSGTTDEYPTTIGIPVSSTFYDTDLSKNVSLKTAGTESYFKIKFNDKYADSKLQSSSGTDITAGKIHIAFSGIELDMELTAQDIEFIKYPNGDFVNTTLANWCAKKWMEAGYYAYTNDSDTAYLSDMKCGSAEIGTCADVSGNETHLSFILAVQKGTANVWE